MNKLLVICPSRGRPEKLKVMVDSFMSTKCLDTTDLLVRLDVDDYHNYELDSRIRCIHVGKQRPITEMINMAWQEHQGYDFYSVTNDDFIYKTKGWDKILTDKFGINHGNDGCWPNGELPTTSCISAEICKSVGYLQMPKLNNLCGDTVWAVIGKECGIITYFPGVHIHHNHWEFKKCEKDKTAQVTSSPSRYQEDYAVYYNWLQNEAKEDIQKVKAICPQTK